MSETGRYGAGSTGAYRIPEKDPCSQCSLTSGMLRAVLGCSSYVLAELQKLRTLLIWLEICLRKKPPPPPLLTEAFEKVSRIKKKSQGWYCFVS
ncbi:hypothetical protein CEXT_136491 [Caerostris extrusa]|uniref:Uncharacterized protein n=1 Tax=Caerostris extrusa TaxID=172846 RepID=A0AAV4U2F8_CAEEX|nr:hypothetical protein CEXT_136491 [Caerostris extrusa]